MSKIAEHGGDDPQDRNVPILVVLPVLRHAATIGARWRPPTSRRAMPAARRARP
jgi:hypothetical protein